MDKSPDAFRTISEVAELLDTPAHVLRFWESRFPQIKPVKRAGGRRYYRPADMALLSGIRRLLHDEGLTIRGVQKILREQGVKHVSGLADDEDMDALFVDVDTETAEQKVAPSAPIALFPTKPAPGTDHAPEVKAEVPQAPEPTEGATAKTETAPHGDTKSDGTPAPDTLSREGELALEEALSGPFNAGGDPVTAQPEPEAAPDSTASDALQNPAPEPPPEPESDRPEFPFDSPVGTPLGVSPTSEAASESSAPVANNPAPAEGGDTAKSAAAPDEKPEAVDMAAAGEPGDAPQDTAKTALPAPLPAFQEITGHWLPADLRALRRGALAPKRAEAEALMQRLQQLRNRVGDLGRVPRR